MEGDAALPEHKLHQEPPALSKQEYHGELRLNIQWQGHDPLDIIARKSESFIDLANTLSDLTHVELPKMTLWVDKKRRIKNPFPDMLLADVLSDRSHIRFVGTPTAEIPAVSEGQTGNKPAISKATPSRRQNWNQIQDEIRYSFHEIKPLLYLPDPEKSKRFLQRLADDPGIKASMRKHKFSVGLLTEMNPAEHTTHEGKTLGLNRNRGEVIELRLRTDRYDGYRDYKVIRTTLCHELSHNVFGKHDRNFYNLMKEIQHDVEIHDWKHGGHKLSQEEFYNPDDSADDLHMDGGGWEGGSYVLGTSDGSRSNEGLSRREILAKAAMSRLAKERKATEDTPKGPEG